jgi:hypothetical protein
MESGAPSELTGLSRRLWRRDGTSVVMNVHDAKVEFDRKDASGPCHVSRVTQLSFHGSTGIGSTQCTPGTRCRTQRGTVYSETAVTGQITMSDSLENQGASHRTR